MLGWNSGYLREQRQAVHLRHVDVREDHVDAIVLVQALQCFDTIPCEGELIVAGSNVAPHPLQHERLKIRFVVDNENLVCAFL